MSGKQWNLSYCAEEDGMRTTDWNFEFSKLPGWDRRYSVPYVYDDFTEIPQTDVLCCIYSVAEVSMCNYTGFLAIIKYKKAPVLYLNVAERFGFCDNVSVSPEGNMVFLQPSIYCKKTWQIKRPVLIIDISRDVFAYVVTHNTNPCYKIVRAKENLYMAESDEHQKKSDKGLRTLCGKKIRTDRLKWHDLRELGSLPEMLQ